MKIKDLAPFLAHGGPFTPTGVVLHGTAGSSASGAISTLRQRGLSYHYLIDKKGAITKCAPSSKVAYHSGASNGWDGKYCNRYTIGIAFVNEEKGDKYPITVEQYDAVVELLKTLAEAIPSVQYVTTHYGVSYPRKTDPIVCDAAKIAEKAGLTYWPGRRDW